jgi:hypothetical protein
MHVKGWHIGIYTCSFDILYIIQAVVVDASGGRVQAPAGDWGGRAERGAPLPGSFG